MATASLANDMSADDGTDGGPSLSPTDQHIIEMLSEEQWTTGAIIDKANERAYSRDLEIEGRDPEDFDQDDDDSPDPVTRKMINDGLQAFRRLGAITYAHKGTSLYRLVYDPRKMQQCFGDSDGDTS